MLEIRVAGPGCKNCLEMEARVRRALAEMHEEASVVKLTEFQDIAAAGIMMTPGLIVNGKILVQGKLPSEAVIRAWLQEALKA